MSTYAEEMKVALASLKPCPFCGGTEAHIRGNDIGDYYVICDTDIEGEMCCGASTSDRSCETPGGAAQRWNMRVSS